MSAEDLQTLVGRNVARMAVGVALASVGGMAAAKAPASSPYGGGYNREQARESTRYAAGMYSQIAEGKDGTLFSNKVEEEFAAKEPADFVKIVHHLTLVFIAANDERYNFAHRLDPFPAWEPDKIPALVKAAAEIDDPKERAEACVTIYEYGESIWANMNRRPTFSYYAVVKPEMYEEVRQMQASYAFPHSLDLSFYAMRDKEGKIIDDNLEYWRKTSASVGKLFSTPEGEDRILTNLHTISNPQGLLRLTGATILLRRQLHPVLKDHPSPKTSPRS